MAIAVWKCCGLIAKLGFDVALFQRVLDNEKNMKTPLETIVERYASSFEPTPVDVLEREEVYTHLETSLKLDAKSVDRDILVAEPLPPAIGPSASGPQVEVSASPTRVFMSTFITIFLAELGDKTQVSTLLMSAEFHRPWVVFLGAGSALITTTLVGVLVGQWLSTRLSPRTLDVAAGVMLALISGSLVWDVLRP